MTMLDTMRRHVSWLKWTLVLVVAAFIAFYMADFSSPGRAASPNDVVATVGGQPITSGAFRRQYQQQLQAYQSAYGNSINQDLLRQLGIERQILQQMIDERAAVAEARRLGLSVSDQEVAQRIFAIPAFQQNGVFAGEEAYARVLAAQRPPISKADFEDSLRRSLLVDKLRSAATDWITVSDADIDDEYRRRNEKVKVDLVLFSADKLRDQVTPSEADLTNYFDSHKESFRIGEKRKIRYLLIDVEALRTKVAVTPSEIEKYYRDNQRLYSTPEQVRASHILLKTEGKDEAAVKAQAERVLKQVKGGADFAALATKISEDEASAKQGGDLDYFGRGRMVKEFEDAAFSLAPGGVSDLVKSQFGYHIIKVVDKRPATVRTLDEVRGQITDQLAYERAQTQAGDMAETMAEEIRKPGDLDKAAAARGLTVQESGFFTKEEPIMGLGPAPELASQAFELKEGAVQGPSRVSRGFVFFTTVGKQDSRLPKFEEVKDKVREEAIRARAQELTKTRAQELAAQFKTDFSAAAKQAGLEVKTSELAARGTAYPEAGISAALDAAVFALPVNGVSAPVAIDNGMVIARVVERQDVKPEELATARDGLKTEMLGERRNRFFSAYMLKARDRMKVEVHQDVLRQIVG
jgi:peptidyl-prolyl cis-trans isomerase D